MFADAVKIGQLYYNLNADNQTAEVTRSSDEYTGDITIPTSVDYNSVTYRITSIGNEAFSDCPGLTSVTIGNSVTSLGRSAFTHCTGLTSVTIGNSVTSIGNYAFCNCTGLTSVTIPNSVASIGGDAFCGCTGLTSVMMGNSVTSIGNYAFDGCTGLTSVTIPYSVTSISKSIFRGCTNLTHIVVETGNSTYDSRNNCNAIIETATNTLHSGCKNTIIPNSVTSIGNRAFCNCTGLTSVTIPNSVASIGDSAFHKCTGLTSVTVPNSVTRIGGSAFNSCTGLTSVTIGNSVTSIGDYAFGYTGLKGTLVIPNSVSNIGNNAFYYCTGLTSVTLGNSVTRIGGSAFYSCTGLTSIEFPNSVTSIGDYAFGYTGLKGTLIIPNSVTSIESRVFYGCTGLTSVTIPNSVTRIEYGAFYNCTGLASIEIPNSVTSIGQVSFSGCTGLKGTLIIPNSVTRIGEAAFSGCRGLTSVTVGNSVTRIEDSAFKGCSRLKSVYNDAITPQVITSSVFNGVDIANCKLYVSKTSISLYQQANIWKDFFVLSYTSYVITWKQDDGTIIDKTAVEKDSLPTHDDPTKPASEEYTYIFSGWVPEIVPVTGDATYVATYCPMVSGTCGESLTWELSCDSVLTISGIGTMTDWSYYNSHAPWYSYRSNIKTIVIKDNVTSIGDGAFKDCTSLTSVTIGNSVTRIGSSAFCNCTSLASIEIPNSVTSIGDYAFSGCSGLTNPVYIAHVFAYLPTSYVGAYTIPDGIELIAGGAFMGCTGLTSVTIPNSVISIGESAFESCSSLISVAIPSGVTTINDNVFWQCTSLSSISLPNTITHIGYEAFAECSSLQNIVIPHGVVYIEEEAFMGSGLMSITLPQSVTNLEATAFSYCNYLSDVIVNWTIPITISPSVFENLSLSNMTLHVPCGSSTTYRAADIWKDFGMIVGGDSCTYIITWKNYDGMILFKDTVQEGTMPVYIGETPNRSTTADYVYEFSGWIPEIVPVTGDAAYMAVYDSILRCPQASGICGIDGDNLIWSICDSILTISGAGAMANYTTSSAPWNSYRSYIKEVIIEEDVTSIGKCAFESCTSLTNATIGNSVTSIENCAFRYCSGLTSVTIGNSVTNIKYMAFSGCTDLTSITIPDGVTSIGSYAFNHCSGLMRIVVESGNSVYDSRNNCNAIIETASNTLIVGCENTIIPNDITCIGKCAFESCTSLTNATIGNSVTSIGPYAFSGCSGLASINIPNSVTSIGHRAFQRCSSLRNVYVKHTMPLLIDSTTFISIPLDSANLHVPCGTVATYRATDVWKDFGTIDDECRTFAITWKDYDGTILAIDSVLENAMPEYSGITPSRDTTTEYTYHFIGWEPEVTLATKDTTYVAVYDSCKSIVVNYLNADNSILQAIIANECDSTSFDYTGDTPVSCDSLSTIFVGWSSSQYDTINRATNIISTTTYKFTSKSWQDNTNTWQSLQDGNNYLTDREGVQITGGNSASTISKISYSKVRSVKVIYCTNTSSGTGTITISVGGASSSASITTHQGGTSPRTLLFEFPEMPSGPISLEVSALTNSLYICGIAITYGEAAIQSVLPAEIDSNVINLYAIYGKEGYAQKTISFASSDFTWTGTAGSGSAIETTKGRVTLAFDKGYAGNPLRSYADGILTFSGTDGATIEKITIITNTKKGNATKISLNSGGGSFMVDSLTAIWTGNADIVQLKVSEHVQFASIIVVARIWEQSRYITSCSYILPTYIITWKNENVVLKEDTVLEGAMPFYVGPIPSKPATAQYTYVFAGWEPEIVPVDGDATYSATYDSTKIEYNIDITIPDTTDTHGTVTIDGEPTYGDTITLTAIPEEGYHFVEWNDGNTDNPRQIIVLGDTAIYPIFAKDVFLITFVNYNGIELQSDSVEYGAMPAYNGETPVKLATAQYTYTFAGWKPEVVAVTGNAVYTAEFDSVVNQYTITFNNYDGTQLQSGKLDYGTMPAYSGETPQRLATAQYTYTFAGWKPEVVAVTGNAVYTAEFDSVVNQYTITFNNYDGTQLQSGKLDYGAMPAYNGETPVKLATAQYTYSFKGWKPEVVAVTGNAVYTAEFDSVVNQYTITFNNYDGTELQSGKLDYGAMPAYNGETPVKLATAQYTYSFKGWKPEVVAVTGNAVYTAEFDSVVNQYTITFNNYDGTQLQSGKLDYGVMPAYNGETPVKLATAQYTYTFKGWKPEVVAVTDNAVYTAEFDSVVNQYTVTFNNYDGTQLQSGKLDFGVMPAYNGETPQRLATAQYTYSFKGWKPEVVAVTGDAVYTAEFDSVVNQYTITFNNYDGTELQSGKLDYGAMPAYNGETPVKLATAQYTYSFKGWKPEVVAVTGNAVYTAEFDSVVNQYTITFNNYDGTQLQSGKLDYGVLPTYNGATPTKPSDKRNDYTFSGWIPAVVAVTGDATYTAQFDATLIIYNITTEPATGEQHGSVDINGTAYYEATVTLTATPEDGYYFVSWNDGVIDNPRQIVVVSDTTLYPIFAECEPITTSLTASIFEGDSYRIGNEEFTTRGTYRVTLSAANGCDSVVVLRLNVIKLPTYNVRVEVNNESYGSVSGAGTYKKNQEATITATPKAKGNRFTWWYNSATQEKVTANPYTFTVTEDVLWRAVFSRAVKAITIEYRSAPRRMTVDADETYAVVSVSEKLAEINNISGETYYLYDASGKLITSSQDDKQYTLPSGMYIIRIEDQTEKFIVP